jgi:hypothetical protein
MGIFVFLNHHQLPSPPALHAKVILQPLICRVASWATQAQALIDGLLAQWALDDTAFDVDQLREYVEAIDVRTCGLCDRP